MAIVKHDLWTKAELAEARQLAEACEASDAKWAFADWLLAHEPWNATALHTGWNKRADALAAELGMNAHTLRYMRCVSRAWPVKHRVPAASFYAHGRFMSGGPAKAADRKRLLAASPRDRWGKLLTNFTPGAHRYRRNVALSPDLYVAVIAEADANRAFIGDTADELIREALEARAWLAAEAVAA